MQLSIYLIHVIINGSRKYYKNFGGLTVYLFIRHPRQRHSKQKQNIRLNNSGKIIL